MKTNQKNKKMVQLKLTKLPRIIRSNESLSEAINREYKEDEDDMKVYKNRYCKCGCGKRIPIRKSHKLPGHCIPKYLKGHYNIGTHRSLESRIKMAKMHKHTATRTGSSVSLDSKKKISDSVKKRYREGYQGTTKYDLFTYLRSCERQSYRQGLGFNPLNTPFRGSMMHHIDKENVIFIPVDLHRENWHRLNRPATMKIINSIALTYLDTEDDYELLIDSMLKW